MKGIIYISLSLITSWPFLFQLYCASWPFLFQLYCAYRLNECMAKIMWLSLSNTCYMEYYVQFLVILGFTIKKGKKNNHKISFFFHCQVSLYLFGELPLKQFQPMDSDYALLRKWLLERPITAPESQLARLVLMNMNWGVNKKVYI